MYLRSLLMVGAVVVLSATFTSRAGTLTWSLTPPAVDGPDIASFTGASADADNVGYGDDAATYVAGNRPAQGQTFITGPNAGGYELISVTVQHKTYVNGFNDDFTFGTATVRIGTADLDAVTFSGIASDTFALSGANGFTSDAGGEYVTFTFTEPIALDANTTYAFDISCPGGYFELNGTSVEDAFADGRAYSSGANGAGDATAIPQDYDRVFAADLELLTALPPFRPLEVSPADGAAGVTNPVTLQAVVVDRGTTFSSAAMYLDGTLVDATITPNGSTNTISFTTILPEATTHTGLVYVTGADASVVSNVWTFTMAGDPGYGIYIHDSTEPTPGSDDIYQFEFATADTNNVEGGDDAASYIAHDRGAQGQNFTTLSDSPNYELTAVWVKHVESYSSWTLVYPEFTETLRITDPSQAGTENFVIYEEVLTVITNAGAEMGLGGVGAEIIGTGNWVEYRLSTPVPLSGNTQYGFDIGAGPVSDEAEYYDWAGIDSDIYGGGAPYTSGLNGVGDDTSSVRAGDRTFMIELSPAGSSVIPNIQMITISGASASLTWDSEPGVNYGVMRKSNLLGDSWTEVTNIPGAGASTMATVPVGDSQEYFRIEGE